MEKPLQVTPLFERGFGQYKSLYYDESVEAKRL